MEIHIIGKTHVTQLAVAAVFLPYQIYHPAAFQEDINPDRWDG